MKNMIIACASLVMVTASVAHAVEVTPEQAQTAAENWVKTSPSRMGSRFVSRTAKSTKTVRSDETGRAVFHAVNFEGGGFVVTAGDTRIAPIIAFSATGCYSGDTNGVFCVLLRRGQTKAVDALALADRKAASSGHGSGEVTPRISRAQSDAVAEWETLLQPSGAKRQYASSGGQKESVDDVRVGPLLKTKWGQRGFRDWIWNPSTEEYEQGPYCPAFDYYTYKNPDLENREDLPCGCTATAGAQLMYYWKYPKSIGDYSNTCLLWRNQTTFVEKVLSSISGTVDYGSMFEYRGDDDPIPSAIAREAVGRLTYNLAVLIGMEWSSGAGSGSSSLLLDMMKEELGYQYGSWVWYDMDAPSYEGGWKPDYLNEMIADFNNALFASLDAKMPVLMSISGDGYNATKNSHYDLGHAIVADGYGYMSGKRYTHLNFGWYGVDDAWFYIPDDPIYLDWEDYPGDYENYYQFDGLGFNINPADRGDIVSGRVLDSSGKPVANATVTITYYSGDSSILWWEVSDARGIYSFKVTSVGTYRVDASSGGASSLAQDIKVSRLSCDNVYPEYSRGARSCNRWGVDLTVVKDPRATVVFDGNGGKFSNGAATKTVEAKPGNLWGKLPMPSKSGYVFDGYYTAKSGGTLVTASSSVPSANATYYARWTSRLGLAAASEWPYEFQTDSWCGQGSVSHDGKDALRSGIIYDGQSSYLITKVTGAGTLTFWWAVSSESGNDALRFLVDGVQKYSISGVKDWAKVTVPISGSGTHTLKWNYTKNGSVTKGEDFGWVDQLSWTPSDQVQVVFDANGGKFSDGKTARYVDAKPGNLWGKHPMPSKSGQVFVGWYTAASGGSLVTSSSKVPNAAATYYAHWTPRLGLAAASEWSGEFTTDSWCGQGAVAADGKDALRSGIIYDGQNSYIQTTVKGSGTIDFWWKVSSESGNDALRFLVDGVQKQVISGERDWARVTVRVTGSGTHTLKWNYAKNGSVTKGQDFAWLDYIMWTEDLDPNYAANWPGVIETGGWYGQYATSHDGNGALRSGSVSHDGESYLVTYVRGPGTLTFWWKVSCEEDYDGLHFFVDGHEKVTPISGQQDWAKVTVNITGSGSHTVEWDYIKDESDTEGQDCGWVDQILWTGSF